MSDIAARPIFSRAELLPYFSHSEDGDRWLDRVDVSIERVNRFGKRYAWSDLAASSRRKKPERMAIDLQYFKDETLLTLYGFAALDRLPSPEGRVDRFNEIMAKAMGGRWDGLQAPKLEFERQLPAPKQYQAWLSASGGPLESHPVAYVRALAHGKKHVEGPTHADAVLMDGPRKVILEAKFLSDVSGSTKYGTHRNQIARNLDAGLDLVDGDAEHLFFVLVTPARFREGPASRLYHYKMGEYRSDPEKLQQDLRHRGEGLDAETLSRNIGSLTWEEICDVISRHVGKHPKGEAVLQFFRERQLWTGA